MAVYLYNIYEAVDRKFIVTKTLSGQAKAGKLVHIMDCTEKNDGSLSVDYLITETGQFFTAKFDNIKQFCKWARPDNFIARHYERLSTKDIVEYLNVTSHNILALCAPIIAALLIIVWTVALLCMDGVTSIIVGIAASVFFIFAVLYLFKKRKSRVTMNVYKKISSDLGVSFK